MSGHNSRRDHPHHPFSSFANRHMGGRNNHHDHTTHPCRRPYIRLHTPKSSTTAANSPASQADSRPVHYLQSMDGASSPVPHRNYPTANRPEQCQTRSATRHCRLASPRIPTHQSQACHRQPSIDCATAKMACQTKHPADTPGCATICRVR